MNEDLKTGDSIPSMRVLARNLKVAVITVQKVKIYKKMDLLKLFTAKAVLYQQEILNYKK